MQIPKYLKCIGVIILVALLSRSGYSQEAPLTPAPVKRSMAAGVKVSSLGPGAEFSLAINPSFNARLGGSYLNLNFTTVKSYDNIEIEYKTTTTIGAISLLADWHPFEKAPIIRFTGGLMYNFNKISTLGYTTQAYSFKNGQYVFTPDDIGKLSLEFKVNPIAPYIGMGFGNVIPKKKLGFLVELGTLYHGSPKVTFTANDPDALIAPTAEQDGLIEDNVKNYYLYPVLSFQLNYKIQ